MTGTIKWVAVLVAGVLICAVSFTASVDAFFQPPDQTRLQPQPTPESVKALMGSWKQSGTDKVNMIRFEPKRMAQFVGGKLHFQRLSYQDGKIFNHSIGGGKQPIDTFEIKDKVLTLTNPKGEKHTFERLEKEPPELIIPPLIIGLGDKLTADKVKDIQDKLAEREAANIKVRMEWKALKNEPDKQKAKFEEMMKIDTADTTYLIDLVKDVGWIDAKRFGDGAAHSAYLIVMHTHDMSLMEGAVKEFEKEVKAKRFDAEEFAGLFDRYRLIVGEPERYGMHTFVNDKGEVCVGPLEDRNKVDQFRKEIGLPPLAEYLKRYKDQNGGKDVQIVDE